MAESSSLQLLSKTSRIAQEVDGRIGLGLVLAMDWVLVVGVVGVWVVEEVVVVVGVMVVGEVEVVVTLIVLAVVVAFEVVVIGVVEVVVGS